MKRKQGTSYCRVQNTVDLDLLSLLFAFSLHSAVCPCSRGKKMSREMSFFAQISNPCSELTLKLAAVCCRYFTTWCERSAHGRWKPSDKTTASRRTARKSGNVPFCNVCLACTCEGSKGSNDRSSRLRLWILVIIALEQKKKKTHRLPRELLNSLHHHHLEPFFHLVLASWSMLCWVLHGTVSTGRCYLRTKTLFTQGVGQQLAMSSSRTPPSPPPPPCVGISSMGFLFFLCFFCFWSHMTDYQFWEGCSTVSNSS